jgi:hypothetical protein
MKFVVFFREKNKFDDILKDVTLKGKFKTKIEYSEHLILGFTEEDYDKINSYIVLKYGEDMKNFDKLVPDRTPVPHVDYTPIRKDRKRG